MRNLLEVVDLHKAFGGIQAVNGCSFGVDEGSITGLIGPNGSGKTTIFNLITGVYKADRGRVLWRDAEIQDLRPHQITRGGIGRTFQITRVFPQMTVAENMVVVTSSFTLTEQLRRALDLLEFVGLYDLRNEPAAHLSYGQQKLLEFARVLMLEPDLILLDEPFAGVNPTLANKLVHGIQQLRKQGKTFVIIDHEMKLIMEVCERIVVLGWGRVIAEGPPEVIREDETVLDAYFGRRSRAHA